MLVSILFGLMTLFTSLLLWQFLGYPLLATLFSKVRSGGSQEDPLYQPFISIIIPTYNEERVIGRRIENLLSQEYPKDNFEVIVVDSMSTDDTFNIAKSFEMQYKNVKVVRERERRGKTLAINFGKAHAKGEIILVTDANTLFSSDVLKQIVPHFKDPRIGAVGGRFVLSNIENKWVGSSSFYWNIESLVRRGESRLDSACLFHGEIGAWRKDIAEANVNLLSDDLDITIQIRKQGYKIAYEPEALAYEAGPTTSNEQIIQKKRTALGTIQCFFKHNRYLWFPRDKYAGLIFPSHKSLQIFSPYLLLGVFASLLALLALRESASVAIFILITATVFVALFLMLKRELIKANLAPNPVSIAFSPGGLLNLLIYVLLHEYIILLAWKDFVFRGYSASWEKVRTTRA